MKRPGLILILLLTTFAYYRWYHVPEAIALQSMADETATMKSELNRLRASIASIKHVSSDEKNVNLPEPRHPSYLISRLSTSAAPAQPSSARLTTVSTSGTRDVGGLICEDMSLEGGGRLDEIITFFRHVEAIRPHVGIRSWSLATSGLPGDGRMSDRATWNTYQMQISYIKSASLLSGDTVIAMVDSPVLMEHAPVVKSKPLVVKRAARPVVLDALPGSGARIEGILVNSRGPSAMIGGRLVQQGAVIDGLRFVGIEDHKARFREAGGRVILVAWTR